MSQDNHDEATASDAAESEPETEIVEEGAEPVVDDVQDPPKPEDGPPETAIERAAREKLARDEATQQAAVQRRDRAWEIFAFLFCGAGLGWLIGLSTSEIIQQTLTSLIAIAIAGAAIMAGVRQPVVGARRIRPGPIAGLVLGIALGSALGVKARTNSWLGVDVDRFVSSWSGAHGLTDAQIRRRLFDAIHPESRPVASASASASEDGGAAAGSDGGTPPGAQAWLLPQLFESLESSVCSRLRAAESDEELLRTAQSIPWDETQREALREATDGWANATPIRQLMERSCDSSEARAPVE